jgi:hypothetical protein
MRRVSISLFLLSAVVLLSSCAYVQTTCPSGGCGYVSTSSYVTTTNCCSANKTYVVKNTCNRCNAPYYGAYYGSAWDPGYGYGYGSYNTGWY